MTGVSGAGKQLAGERFQISQYAGACPVSLADYLNATKVQAGVVVTDHLFAAMQSYDPVTETQKTFYASAVDRMNDLIALRRNRIDASNSALPCTMSARNRSAVMARNVGVV